MVNSILYQYLFILVLIDRIQILVDHILPEQQFRARQEIHLALAQLLIIDPIRIGEKIAMLIAVHR